MSFIIEPILDIGKNELIEHLPGSEFASKTAELANDLGLSFAEKVPILGPMLKKGEQLFGWGKNELETILTGGRKEFESYFGDGKAPDNAVDSGFDHVLNDSKTGFNTINTFDEFNENYNNLSEDAKLKGLTDATEKLENHSNEHTNKVLNDVFEGKKLIGQDNRIKKMIDLNRNVDGSINLDILNPIDDSFINKLTSDTTEEELLDIIADSNIDFNKYLKKGKTKEEKFIGKLLDDFSNKVPITEEYKAAQRKQISILNKERMVRTRRLTKILNDEIEHKPIRNFLLSTEDTPESLTIPTLTREDQEFLDVGDKIGENEIPEFRKVLTPDEIIAGEVEPKLTQAQIEEKIERKNSIKKKIEEMLKQRIPRGVDTIKSPPTRGVDTIKSPPTRGVDTIKSLPTRQLPEVRKVLTPDEITAQIEEKTLMNNKDVENRMMLDEPPEPSPDDEIRGGLTFVRPENRLPKTSATTFIGEDGIPISYDKFKKIIPDVPEDIYEELKTKYEEFKKDNIGFDGIKTIREKISKMSYLDLLKYGAGAAVAAGGVGLALMSSKSISEIENKIDKAYDSMGVPKGIKDVTKSIMQDIRKYGTSQTKKFTDTIEKFLNDNEELRGLRETAQRTLQIFNQPSSSVVTDNENNENYKKANEAVLEKEAIIEQRLKQITKQADIAKESIERAKDKEQQDKDKKEKEKKQKINEQNNRIKKVEEQFDKLPAELERSIRPQLSGDSMKTPINVNIVNRLQSPTTGTNDINDGIDNNDPDNDHDNDPMNNNIDMIDSLGLQPMKKNNFLRPINNSPMKNKLKL